MINLYRIISSLSLSSSSLHRLSQFSCNVIPNYTDRQTQALSFSFSLSFSSSLSFFFSRAHQYSVAEERRAEFHSLVTRILHLIHRVSRQSRSIVLGKREYCSWQEGVLFLARGSIVLGKREYCSWQEGVLFLADRKSVV